MDAPKCKTCGKSEWHHVCHGATSLPAGAIGTWVKRPKKSSGGSSAVERRPSKSDVAGSNPAPRSKSSTAARKDVQAPVGRPDNLPPSEQGGFPALSEGEAGTQAPPVDADLTARGTPRKRAPKGTFNRKAYQREKARERRAKLKASPPSGLDGTT